MTDEEIMKEWRARAQDQRSSVINLFLSYAVALLGLLSSILIDADTHSVKSPKFFCASGLGALVSVGVGCVVVLVRLREARLRARVSRLQKEGSDTNEIASAHSKIDGLKIWTERLITSQVILFTFALVAFLAWLITAYGEKLQMAAG